ncbi:hypothetical protein RHMOL_Rhmol12G0072700 [Rhododendron molle]|uniref:Uncharacterized protein n=1 Tax=Rhododendron molle TaxID=49168 RepID=A0ACC0LGZ2_RHOML|nr:hypothetical protein RHMOL_Rhmol12G0072700 [Rhododendron molle]
MLLSLELYQVVIAGDVLSSLVSSCPLLERLTFTSSNSFDYLEIVAPKLKYFSCEGLFRSICVRMPHIADVTVVMKGSRNQLGFNEGERSNSVMLLRSIPMVEFLVLDYPYVKCLAARGVRERLPTTLNNLQDLLLHDICFGEPDEVSIVLYSIRCSPNLQGISIRAFHGATAAVDPVVELFDLQGWSKFSLKKLFFVLMEEVSGTDAEMEFIKLLLAKSPTLQSMRIKLKSMEVVKN